MTNIVCFGEVLWDKYTDRIELGGAPFNVFFRLSQFDKNAKFISSVGNDKLGVEILDFFKKNNLNSSFLQIDKTRKTGTVKIKLDAGEPSYEITQNVAWDFIVENKNSKSLKIIDLLIFGSLSCRNEQSYSTLKKLINKSKIKVLDLNLRQNYYDNEKISYLVKSSNFLKINLEEMFVLKKMFEFKSSDHKGIIKEIFNFFDLQYLCLTNGSVNSFIYNGIKFYEQKSFKVNAIDNVGAGDNFLAAFIWEFFAKKSSIQNSLRIASAYGALATTKNGATTDISSTEVNHLVIS